MRPVRPSALLALSLSVAAVGLTACGGSDPGTGAGESNYVDGQSFSLALTSDPGALDPQGGVTSTLFQLSKLAYDSLVSVDADGNVESQLASDWSVDGTTVTFEIADGITCADGSDFTAQTVVDNITYVEDPKNQSPFLGVFIPAGATAEADGSTVTMTLAEPSPFVLASMANLPMVCDAGLTDRKSLKDGTAGTGPYTLTEAVPGDRYTYSVREDYTWGPDGASTSETGTPATIVAKVVTNETTAANQLLSGDLNFAGIVGPDAERLDAAGLTRVDAQAVQGEQWYNQNDGHLTADPAVRAALTRALDLEELQKVLTSGKGGPATQFAVVAPAGCTGSSVEGNVAGTDVAAAEAALDEAGWVKGSDGIRAKDGEKLALSFVYDASLGTGGSAAAELAVAAWKEVGIDVTGKQLDQTAIAGAMFGTGDWDIAWEPVNINTPDQIVPFVSGPGLADGGTNFSGIDNADYTAGVEKAMTTNGAEGCDEWLAAEGALFAADDVIPFANNLLPFFGKGAEFDVVGNVVPTSIRMLG
ncbi:ABC transporter substrate-binding protein [Nocardioides sp. GY 10113]|uniref:ABC transporter substrate-binding protein n=1 Tax=Nocardioides sp. GY 10113 TaxID=2569761 RepID=UPI0010A869CE|nr:ABC transporter substrate-binding protein [Nocardioides sp. GY 10113]TIC80484.1 ABC transporter substrate-binding protein [Nocardioides sp. GY 10113]